MDGHDNLKEIMSAELDAMGIEGRVKLCFKGMWSSIIHRVYSWDCTDDSLEALFALQILLEQFDWESRTVSVSFNKLDTFLSEANWVKGLITLRNYGLLDRVDSSLSDSEAPCYTLNGFFTHTGYSSKISPWQIAILESLEHAHHPLLHPGDRVILHS